mmetsp:Transcript_9915/g.20728  ORF Transcript_9915/g.20728 Transcript_9915/m.20728 type:complete len:399 (+) Transcript_9915:126-1322(+)
MRVCLFMIALVATAFDAVDGDSMFGRDSDNSVEETTAPSLNDFNGKESLKEFEGEGEYMNEPSTASEKIVGDSTQKFAGEGGNATEAATSAEQFTGDSINEFVGRDGNTTETSTASEGFTGNYTDENTTEASGTSKQFEGDAAEASEKIEEIEENNGEMIFGSNITKGEGQPGSKENQTDTVEVNEEEGQSGALDSSSGNGNVSDPKDQENAEDGESFTSNPTSGDATIKPTGSAGIDDYVDAPTSANDYAPTFDFAPTPTRAEPTYIPPTPTLRPAVPYVSKGDDPLDDKILDKATGDWFSNDSTIDEMEHDRSVIIALSVVFGVMFFFSVFVAYQMLENPDGCCASVCRISVACWCGIARCICYPCRSVCGCTGSPSGDHVMVPGDGGFTHDLELS